ncbi:MAG: hypothetical protein J4G05_03860 [Chlorobi bacterium]|nr:hypothetical protein [Chlorobiota bacterium]
MVYDIGRTTDPSAGPNQLLQQEERFVYRSRRGSSRKYERESKREWLNPSGDGTAPGYEWTYYLPGGSKEQLSVWQGMQTSQSGFCGSTGGTQVYLYPTEYST